jgi:hypothetical protein
MFTTPKKTPESGVFFFLLVLLVALIPARRVLVRMTAAVESKKRIVRKGNDEK